MTRLFTIIVFSVFSSFAFGQITITVDENPSSNSGKAGDFEVICKVNVTNDASAASTFTWVRDDSGFVPGWTSGVCDKTQCYFETVGTQSFALEPGESSILDLHLYPNTNCGNGFGLITLTDDNDATNTIEIRYDFIVETDDGSDCEFTSSVDNFELDFVKVYPNPANDFFTLTDVPVDLEYIKIYNILGSEVKSFNAVSNANYSINELNAGLYLVKLTNARGANLNTIKLHKN